MKMMYDTNLLNYIILQMGPKKKVIVSRGRGRGGHASSREEAGAPPPTHDSDPTTEVGPLIS